MYSKTNWFARFLRFFFHHFYHSLAWTYDLVAAIVSLGRWNHWVRSILPHIEGSLVLELGHGPGHLQLALHQRGIRTIGLDESRQMGQQTSRRLRRHGQSSNLVRAWSQIIPFGNTFDTVVATFPTEYIVDPRTLAEIWRVLRPGGKLIVLPGAWVGGKSLPEAAARWLFKITGQGEEIRASLWDRFKVPFERAGFQVEVRVEETRGGTLLFLLARKVVK